MTAIYVLYFLSISLVTFRFWSHRKLRANSLKAVSENTQSVVEDVAGDFFYSDMKEIFDVMDTGELEKVFETKKRQWEVAALKQSLHDLNSPMSALVQICSEMTHGNPAYNRLSEGLIEQMSTQISTSKQLMEDGTVVFRKADIVRCISRSVQTVSLIHKHIVIKTQVFETSFRILHSPALLERAIINLLENASEHAKHCVLVSLGLVDHHLIIAIEDDGPGVQLPYKFTSGRICSEHGNRSALGLASVQHIAKKHGGKLYYKSSALGGAKFEIELEVI